MENEFATYEISLKIKNLGFNKPCLGLYFNIHGNNVLRVEKNDFLKSQEQVNYIFGNTEIGEAILAPLWQQVIDWLRTEHNIIVNVTPIWKNISIGNSIIDEFVVHCNRDHFDKSYKDYKDAQEAGILMAIQLLNT